MSEPSYHPSSQGPMPTSTIALHDVRTGLPMRGQLGEGCYCRRTGARFTRFCIRLRRRDTG